jgi:Ca2+-binding RTX toxin-like protein
MARLTAFAPIDMFDDVQFFGQLVDHGPSEISVAGAGWVNTYSGSFHYPAPGVVTGTVEALERSGDAGPILRLSDIASDAYGVSTALQAGNIDLLYATLFFGADRFHGSAGDDTLRAMAGNDTLLGRAGNDVLIGDEGGDRIRGGAGDDSLFGSTGEDRLSGGRGADMLVGGDARDVLHGGKGSDSLDGGAGDDRLAGGAGADSFHFMLGGETDRITDFDPAEGDRLMLDSDLGVAVLTPAAIVEEYGHVTRSGDMVLSFGDGDRIILVGFDDPVALAAALGVF